MKLLVLLSLSSCIDYNPEANIPPQSISNPPALESPIVTDYITQTQNPAADILWIIDNSCSMSNEQNKLAENFPQFMNYFVGSELDYHIGVTSTDVDNSYNGSKGTLREGHSRKPIPLGPEVLQEESTSYYIDEYTANPISVFVDMATMGTLGAGTEKGLGATYLALETKRETANIGFYRNGAAIHTITISDEIDQTPETIISRANFIDWYGGLKGQSSYTTFSAITKLDVANNYEFVASKIGGLVFDIERDWSPFLSELGIQASSLQTEYFLSQLPVMETINVSVINGFIIYTFTPEEWTYSEPRNSISFIAFQPLALSVITIQYTPASTVLE
jgi:hypothetical protein